MNQRTGSSRVSGEPEGLSQGIPNGKRALFSRLSSSIISRWLHQKGARPEGPAPHIRPANGANREEPLGEGATQEEIESRLLELLKHYEGARVIGLDYPPSYDFRPRWGNTRPPHQGLIDLFAPNRGEYLRLLEEMVELEPYFRRISDQFSHDRPGEPGWIGGPINPLDTALLYYFVARYKPRTYLEIGSGVTTLFAARAKRDHHLPTRIVSIDPNPRTWVDSVCDVIIREPFETTDLSVFEELRPGDIVFMDGSHRTFMNSDVTVMMLDVIPVLKPGVIIHFHDILIPYDYPMMFLKWYWSEQYILAAYLLGAAEKVHVLMPSRFVSDFEELKVILAPILQRWQGPQEPWLMGGSLWFTHRGAGRSPRR
jgi:Methyltransferase domain